MHKDSQSFGLVHFPSFPIFKKKNPKDSLSTHYLIISYLSLIITSLFLFSKTQPNTISIFFLNPNTLISTLVKIQNPTVAIRFGPLRLVGLAVGSTMEHCFPGSGALSKILSKILVYHSPTRRPVPTSPSLSLSVQLPTNSPSLSQRQWLP